MPERPSSDGWAEHQRQQRRVWLALTPLQRILWLEGAKRFHAIALGAARRARRSAPLGPNKP